MQAEIAGYDDETAGVEVTDSNGVVHQVVVSTEGEIVEHTFVGDGYSVEGSEELIGHVQVLARYTVHWEGVFDILDNPWNPTVIREGIEAIQSMSDERFREEFKEMYNELQVPSVDVPFDHVEVLAQGVYLDGNGGVRDTTGVMVGVTPPGEEFSWADSALVRGATILKEHDE